MEAARLDPANDDSMVSRAGTMLLPIHLYGKKHKCAMVCTLKAVVILLAPVVEAINSPVQPL